MKLVQLTKLYWPDNGGGIARVVESIVRWDLAIGR